MTRDDLPGDGTGRLSPAFFAVLVAGTTFPVDIGVPDPFGDPKAYLLILLVAVGLAGWATALLARGGSVRVTVVELFLAVALVLAVAGHPALLDGAGGDLLPVTVALLGVTFLTRQLAEMSGPAARTGPTALAGDLLHAVWINGAALALVGLRQAVAAGTFRYADGLAKTPMTGPLGTANAYGALVGLGAVAAVAAALREDARGSRWMLVSAALLCLVALVGNGSRGALLGVLAGCGVVATAGLVRRGGPWARRVRDRPVVAGAAVVGLLGAAAGGLAALDADSSSGRLLAWRVSAPMVVDHPLAGVGFGRFPAEWTSYQADFFAQSGREVWAPKATWLQQPQSDWMLAFAERGVPGGLLELAVWGGAVALLLLAALGRLRGGPPSRDPDHGTGLGASGAPWWPGLLAVLVALLVHGSVDSVRAVIPVAVVGHALLGLVPAPGLRLVPGRFARVVVFAVAAAVAGLGFGRAVGDYRALGVWGAAVLLGGPDAPARLETARDALPLRPGLRVALGETLVDAGRVDEGLDHLEWAARHGADPDVLLTLSATLLRDGRPDAAEARARAYLAAFPDRLRPRLALARVHLARGEGEAAQRELARVIRKETAIRSPAVDRVAAEAEALWRRSFDAPPPTDDRAESPDGGV